MESARAGKSIELVQLGRGVPRASQELPDQQSQQYPLGNHCPTISTVSPQPPLPPQPTISGFINPIKNGQTSDHYTSYAAQGAKGEGEAVQQRAARRRGFIVIIRSIIVIIINIIVRSTYVTESLIVNANGAVDDHSHCYHEHSHPQPN